MMRVTSSLVLLVSALTACDAGIPEELLDACVAAAAARGDDLPPTNLAIVTFAHEHLGETIDRGECTDLAIAAVDIAGARPFDALGPTGNDADYVWGELVGVADRADRDGAAFLPGDILQYRDFAQRIAVGDQVYGSTADHHTAVLSSVSEGGSRLCVYHQNSAGRRFVGFGVVDLAGLRSGTIRVYRPIPK